MIRYHIEAYDLGGTMRDMDYAQTKREAVQLARRMTRDSIEREITRIAIYPAKGYETNYDHEVWGWFKKGGRQ